MRAPWTSWPKTFPPLSAEQRAISDDFMKYWHEVLPRRFGVVEQFNQKFALNHCAAPFLTTLEVGAGLGEHLAHETLSPEQEQNYVALDIRQNMVDELRRRYPRITALTADCQARLPFADGHFDRILAIHVLEHLPDLPAAAAELHRVCRRDRGRLYGVIPCEGGLAYSLARRISAQRIFEQRYKQPYRWFIEREHVNVPSEIFTELSRYFDIERRSFFPLLVPVQDLNLCIGFVAAPKRSGANK